jgi:hypothetical protein
MKSKKNKYAPKYNQKKWTRNKYIQRGHNCYSYFLNKIDKNVTNACKKTFKKYGKCQWPQPGLVKKFKNNSDRATTCKAIYKRIKADNKSIFKTTMKQKCPKNYYKGALAINPKKTFHFYRQDKSGYWSHKDGSKKPTRYDKNGKKIKDPKKAARNYKTDKYPKFCNYYCIPSSSRKKKQSIRNKKWSNILFKGWESK